MKMKKTKLITAKTAIITLIKIQATIETPINYISNNNN